MPAKAAQASEPAVTDVLPIRYPFLMIDRVLRRTPETVEALKNVSHDEWYLTGHFPDNPIMPGTLITEGMAQTAGVLIAQLSGDRQASGFLVGIDRARFRRQVVPGDQIRYRVQLIKARAGWFKLEAEATVEGERVAEATLSVMSPDGDQAEGLTDGR